MNEHRIRPLLVVAILCTALALLACDQPQAITVPAHQLRLELDFLHALSPSTQVIIDVNVLIDDAGHWSPVTLAKHQSLTVNGQSADADSPPQFTDQFTAPRAPAGGEYRIVYTDEHGQQTTAVVPAPQQVLTITMPAAHAQIPIPPPGASFAVHYTAPFPLTSPFAHAPFAQIGGDAAGNCKAAAHTPAGTPTATPTEAVPSEPFCISIRSAQADMTGIALVSDTGLVAKAGFGNLAPGPGQVAISVGVYGDIPTATGFAGVRIHFLDSTSIPITWV